MNNVSNGRVAIPISRVARIARSGRTARVGRAVLVVRVARVYVHTQRLFGVINSITRSIMPVTAHVIRVTFSKTCLSCVLFAPNYRYF